MGVNGPVGLICSHPTRVGYRIKVLDLACQVRAGKRGFDAG